MKKFVKQLIRFLQPLLHGFISIFFKKQYLKGRHFEKYLGGYVWALRALWSRNILLLGKPYPWPVAMGCFISKPENLFFHPDNLDNFQSPGTYFQNLHGKIYIGEGTYIAPNVGLITSNHDLENLDNYSLGEDIVLGKHCWLGMNAVVLSGVVLGDKTIVGAGSVVTKSFPQGSVVIAGVPAKIIKTIDTSQ